MKIVLLSEVFAKNMGYIENMLPKYLSRTGADVHVVTMGLPPYYKTEARTVYKGFAEMCPQSGTVEPCEGYMVHVIGHKQACGYMRAVGLKKKLEEIRPDIVQTITAIGWLPLQAAISKNFCKYKLFTGTHYHSSVFPLARRQLRFWHKDLLRCRIQRSMPGWLVSLATEKCYAIALDCAEIAVRFFGVPRKKIEVCPLGVDTNLFTPILSAGSRIERQEVRHRLGFHDTEIVCIYTGRFTEDKNPLALASAVARLRAQGEPFRALFVGSGPQKAEIEARGGSIVRPFVPVYELPALYRASDIGVWPTQESLSMLDAAACGLPIVANDTMSNPERLEGNGVSYRLNDVADLKRALLGLKHQQHREKLGANGAAKVARHFSWQSIAERRLRDYEVSMGFSTTAQNVPIEEYQHVHH